MRKDDIAFMPDTYAAEVEKLPLAAHAILWLTVTFTIVAIIWANLARIDEVAHAEGRVIPSSQLQIVQNLEGGILAEVLVKPGDTVSKDQDLMRLDDTRFASSFNEGKLTSNALIALVARLEAEVAGVPFVPPEDFPEKFNRIIENEKSLYHARKTELQSAVDILNQQLTQHTQTLAELNAENKS